MNRLSVKKIVLLLVVLITASCNSSWRLQKFHYLNKVAAVYSAEKDSVKTHLDRRMEAVSQQHEIVQAATDTISKEKTLVAKQDPIAQKQPGMLNFTYQEIKRITLAHSELKPGQCRGGAMAVQSEKLGLWLNLIVFFVMFGLFLVLLWWAIKKKQSGCLASGIAVVAIIVLFLLALGF